MRQRIIYDRERPNVAIGVRAMSGDHEKGKVCPLCGEFLADRTATQYDRLLPAACCPSVRLSVCNAVHCGSHGWCTRLKLIPACS